MVWETLIRAPLVSRADRQEAAHGSIYKDADYGSEHVRPSKRDAQCFASQVSGRPLVRIAAVVGMKIRAEPADSNHTVSRDVPTSKRAALWQRRGAVE